MRAAGRRRAGASAVAACLALFLAGCGGQGSSQVSGGHAPITVYAAASLHRVFDAIGAQVAAETGTEVRFQYGGSSDLATQLGEGGPGDVFASADEAQMDVAVRNGTVGRGSARPFATNTLTVVTPPTDPAGVTRLSDIARPGVRTVVCAPQVPCGAAAGRLFGAASLQVKPVSEESAVTDVLGKVTSGQADAGLVYVSDAKAAGAAVHVVATPEARGIVNRYPIAVTTHGAQDPARAATAQRFVQAVLGAQGRKTLQDAGFGVPTGAGR